MNQFGYGKKQNNFMAIIELKITRDQKLEADKKYSQFKLEHGDGGYNNYSFCNGANVLDSFLSQIVIADYFDLEKDCDTYDYDFISNNGKKIDLKTKSKSNIPPMQNWYASVPAYQQRQKCDYYFFNRINRDLTILWFVGYIEKIEFWKLSTSFKKGDIDPSSSKNKTWVFPADTNCIQLKNLKHF